MQRKANLFNCLICEIKCFENSWLKEHTRKHRGNKNKCVQCDKINNFRRHIKRHIWKHKGKENKCFQCDKKKGFKRHLNKMHRNHMSWCEIVWGVSKNPRMRKLMKTFYPKEYTAWWNLDMQHLPMGRTSRMVPDQGTDGFWSWSI